MNYDFKNYLKLNKFKISENENLDKNIWIREGKKDLKILVLLNHEINIVHVKSYSNLKKAITFYKRVKEKYKNGITISKFIDSESGSITFYIQNSFLKLDKAFTFLESL